MLLHSRGDALHVSGLSLPLPDTRQLLTLGGVTVLVFVGALVSLMKGLDYEEAAVLLGIAGVLHYCRKGFYRRGGLITEPLDGAWLSAAAIAVALSLWAGLFAYKRVPYAHDLRWQFAVQGNASRFLRASFGTGALLAGTAFWYWLAGRGVHVPRATPDEVVATALPFATRSDVNLAFTGDKSFIVSKSDDAIARRTVKSVSAAHFSDSDSPFCPQQIFRSDFNFAI